MHVTTSNSELDISCGKIGRFRTTTVSSPSLKETSLNDPEELTSRFSKFSDRYLLIALLKTAEFSRLDVLLSMFRTGFDSAFPIAPGCLT